jgi:hypothetical protein
MDTDQIKKLIKLANNNSDENEANSASRAVCRMLAEYDFTYIAKEFDYNKWCLRHHCPKAHCKCG